VRGLCLVLHSRGVWGCCAFGAGMGDWVSGVLIRFTKSCGSEGLYDFVGRR
jgi:hypothetical protein